MNEPPNPYQPATPPITCQSPVEDTEFPDDRPLWMQEQEHLRLNHLGLTAVCVAAYLGATYLPAVLLARTPPKAMLFYSLYPAWPLMPVTNDLVSCVLLYAVLAIGFAWLLWFVVRYSTFAALSVAVTVGLINGAAGVAFSWMLD